MKNLRKFIIKTPNIFLLQMETRSEAMESVKDSARNFLEIIISFNNTKAVDLILDQIKAIGLTLSGETCLKLLNDAIPTLFEGYILKSAIVGLIFLMNGEHYDVQRVYEVCNMTEKDFEIFLKDVQEQIRLMIHILKNRGYDLQKIDEFSLEEESLNYDVKNLSLK